MIHLLYVRLKWHTRQQECLVSATLVNYALIIQVVLQDRSVMIPNRWRQVKTWQVQSSLI